MNTIKKASICICALRLHLQLPLGMGNVTKNICQWEKQEPRFFILAVSPQPQCYPPPSRPEFQPILFKLQGAQAVISCGRGREGSNGIVKHICSVFLYLPLSTPAPRYVTNVTSTHILCRLMGNVQAWAFLQLIGWRDSGYTLKICLAPI